MDVRSAWSSEGKTELKLQKEKKKGSGIWDNKLQLDKYSSTRTPYFLINVK